ncbi:PilZ domain-containing protein [Simiduia sp. 21SJ11W-1]|uniref:PilZ domain-containing protein n=1 Tax=Simiduia sp. 21SJ11W-1 TaxID=2909669 RepID=UPI0020A17A37|nr:PilZ domain-containing protein [Simiduia sp. 21SJ11W-1]UTA48493.1 PilZ domain-containing protein [Simiduia sp. 21SJ11W-1]
MTTSPTEDRERRYFPRVHYRAYATLTTTKKKFDVHIIDVSFNGALAALVRPHDLSPGEEIILSIEAGDDNLIKMQGKLAHQREHMLGIECRALGIDNQARLRELLKKEAERANERSVTTMLDDHERRH